MKEGLAKRLDSLPLEKKNCFLCRLYNILNDRYNSFVYGGISDKEYPDPPKAKKEKVEEVLYAEMFENKPMPSFI
jgi:hypothetical protein